MRKPISIKRLSFALYVSISPLPVALSAVPASWTAKMKKVRNTSTMEKKRAKKASSVSALVE